MVDSRRGNELMNHGERLAAIETKVEFLTTRVIVLGDRSHDQAGELARVGAEVTFIRESMENMVEVNKEGFARLEGLSDRNRREGKAEHDALYGQLAPIKKDYLDRLAVKEERGFKRVITQPYLLVAISSLVAIGLGILALFKH